jgi:2-keto-3-deoxy-L-rhamnonate aldolase RhmA
MHNPLLEKLREGGAANSIWLATGSVAVAELCARARPDAIVFDLQHGLWDPQSLFSGIAAVRGLSVPLARTRTKTAEEIGFALDMGALGVIVPLIESAEEAAAVAAAAKYPPDGIRSAGGHRPLLDRVEYIGTANQHILVSVIIETQAGVRNAAAIAAVPGVDLVFVGAGDLALVLGTFPGTGPKHEAVVQELLAICRKAGRTAGILTRDAAAAVQRRQQGFQFMSIAADQDFHAHALAAVSQFASG